MTPDQISSIPNPDEIDSLFDLLKYAWVAGIYWITRMLDRITALEKATANTPTNEQVEARVDKEITKVITKLDKLETLLIEVIRGRTVKPDIKLGE